MRYSLRSLFILLTLCCLCMGHYSAWRYAWEHSDYTVIKPITFGNYTPTTTYTPHPETKLCVVRYFHHEEDQYITKHYGTWPRLFKWPRIPGSRNYGILYVADGDNDAAWEACEHFKQSATCKQDEKWLSHQSTEKSAYEMGLQDAYDRWK